MRFLAAKETYRRAELRLRAVLFGDGVYSGGRLRGEDARDQASLELRRMRSAFDEVVTAAGPSPESRGLEEDLVDAARDARSKPKTRRRR